MSLEFTMSNSNIEIHRMKMKRETQNNISNEMLLCVFCYKYLFDANQEDCYNFE